jgi:hypothetical protein
MVGSGRKPLKNGFSGAAGGLTSDKYDKSAKNSRTATASAGKTSPLHNSTEQLGGFSGVVGR